MKPLLCMIVFVLFANRSHSQLTTGEITYRFEANGEKKLMKLYFDDSTSLFVYNKEGWDTNYASFKGYNYNDSFGLDIKVSQYDSIGQMVYRNFKNKTIKLRQTSVGPLQSFTVDDVWKEIDWEILKNEKVIAGYSCQKAVGYFRGRKYTAWFSKEIKLPLGPWKLFGLPGLIVSAYDKEKVFNVTLTEINYNSDSTPILMPTEAENKTIKDYVYYLDHSAELVHEKIKSKKLPKGISIGGIIYQTPIRDIRKASFEKEYEWEQKTNQSNQMKIDIQEN